MTTKEKLEELYKQHFEINLRHKNVTFYEKLCGEELLKSELNDLDPLDVIQTGFEFNYDNSIIDLIAFINGDLVECSELNLEELTNNAYERLEQQLITKSQ